MTQGYLCECIPPVHGFVQVLVSVSCKDDDPIILLNLFEYKYGREIRYILSLPLISSLLHRHTSVSITPRVGLGRVSRDSNNGSHSSKNSTALCILASRNRNRSSS